MFSADEELTLESYAILEGLDKGVVFLPHTPTWDDNQPDQYRKSTKSPHRLLRLPVTNRCNIELQLGRGLPQIHVDVRHPEPRLVLPDTSTGVRAATWRVHWPETCRGTCACVGISMHPNTLDSPVDSLLYWDLSAYHTPPSRQAVGPPFDYGLVRPGAVFTMTLAVNYSSESHLETTLSFNFSSSLTTRTLRREVWVQGDSVQLTLFPFISTVWGFAEVDMTFVGYLKPGILELKTLCRWKILQKLLTSVKRLDKGRRIRKFVLLYSL
uniref:Neur_chan_LBD domain-containing protein n=1 Tax=Mesocestoides corti TaxID=53468 RepID=A0A5K3FG06_MESCO